MWKGLNDNPIAWYEKNMLYEDFMSDVEGSSNKGNTSKKDLLMSNWDNDQHDTFEFPNDDPSKNLLFSKLLSNARIWEWLQFDNWI
jgi:hypothetical protein